ncbi:MAG: translation initiation factor [bacterium]
MAKQRDERAPDLEQGALTHNPFRALAGAGEGSAPRVPEPTPEPAAQSPADLAGKLVLSRAARGKRGKTVTRLVGVGGGDAGREELLHSLRKALGVGGQLETDAIVLQGDCAPRVAAWLEAHGARNIVGGD